MTKTAAQPERSYALSRFESNRPIEVGLRIADLRVSDAKGFHEKYAASFVARDCPACGSSAKAAQSRFLDLYGVSRCRRCGLVFVDPCPDKDALAAYYSSSASTAESNRLLESRARTGGVAAGFDRRVETIARFLEGRQGKPTSILEVGCSTGGFMERCAKELGGQRFTLAGIDLDPRAVETARAKGLEARCANAEDEVKKNGRRYDLVVHFELLEHLVDPRGFIASCRALLTEDGAIYFSTPNRRGLDNAALPYGFPRRMMAHAIFPPFHLSGFDPTSVTMMLASLGFLDIDVTTPGRLDVDLLRVHAALGAVEPPFGDLTALDEGALAVFQEVLAALGASSHMHVFARKGGS